MAKLLRGKLKAMLADKRPDLVAPAAVWAKPWVVHINHWGQGHDAVLRYLARYVFRVAITNTRVVALDDHTVTIRYKQRKSSRWRTCRMPGHEFVRRFLQHVLPKGLHKVRYFGLWHPSKRQRAAQARLLLELDRTTPPATEPAASSVHNRHRTTALSKLRPRPAPLHPQAHPKICPRTMTHFSRCQTRLSLLCASLRRHRLPRPTDQIIFLSNFNNRSTDLRCPAIKLRKSLATVHSALVSADF